MSEWRADFELLQAFSRQGDQPAFATLTRRHLDLVYATALRKVTDGGAAEEICQNVFGALARKAWQFAPDDSLPSWLHRTTLLESKSWLRGELRRRRREETAAELGTTMKTCEDQPAFHALVPLLDEALLSLREKDRTALLLRFYENHSLHEVGAAVGVSEDAARMRVQSALEKLSDFFKRHGFKTTSVAVATAALEHTAATASAAVASAVVSAALEAAPPALSGLGLLLARLVNLTRKQRAVLGIILLALLLSWSWRERHSTNSDEKLTQMTMKQNPTLLAIPERPTLPGAPVAFDRTAGRRFPFPRLLSIGLTAQVALAQSPGQVVAWGDNHIGQTNVPAAAQSGVVAIAIGAWHVVALKNDGAVVAWGAGTNNTGGTPNFGQSLVPVAAQSGVIAVAAGPAFSVALKRDGRVVVWGINTYGQTNVPVAAQSRVRVIATSRHALHVMALKDNGSVVVWGYNYHGQTNVPVAAQSGVRAIAAGHEHCLALKDDSSVVAWGGIAGQTNVPVAAQSDVITVAAGGWHSLALKNDGSVVAWGDENNSGASNVPVAAQSGVTAIAAGDHFSVALKNNGMVVAWGRNDYGQTNVPAAAQSGVVAIAAGGYNVVALKNDGSVVAWGRNDYGQANVPTGLTGVTAIAAGHVNSLALRGSGWELNTPSADASATVTSTISPNGINATVILDGSRSSDPDGDPLQYIWYAEGAPVATGVVAHPVLPVGTLTIALVVNDGRFSATNAVAVEVITPATAVSRLVLLVENADLGTRNSQPLLAALLAARSAFDRGNFTVALNQLSAFQNQVRAQIAPRNPALADQFITAAQRIIAVVSGR